jgi:hypothetical protein
MEMPNQEKPQEKVRRFRGRAEELRVIASNLRHPVARKTFADVASAYDKMADRWENGTQAESSQEREAELEGLLKIHNWNSSPGLMP